MDQKPTRLFQISLRTLLEIIAAMAVILTLAYRHGTIGRFQVVPSSEAVLLLDTATGKTWTYDRVNDTWAPSPAPGLGK